MTEGFLNRKKIYYLFWGMVVLLKIFLMCGFSSDYQEIMFKPFVACFLEGNNPYEYYYNNSLLPSFPYPPLMLLIVSLLGGMGTRISNIWLSRFVFKLPLLIFDFLGLYYLNRLLNGRKKYILVLYFASPIILFSTYMHGQLDIIPTVLLVMSLHYLINENSERDIILSSLFLGASIATKMHIIAVVPAIFLFVVKNKKMKSVLCFCFGSVLLFLGSLAPFWGKGIVENVFKNREQILATRVFIEYGTVRLLLPITLIVVIYLKIFQLNIITKELLLSIVGVIFAVFLSFVAPMPGWFVWIVPFIYVYFVSVNDNKYGMLYIYGMFNLVYIFYFVFCHESNFVNLYVGTYSIDSLKIKDLNIINIIFTIMTSMLLVIVWSLYQYGLVQNSIYKRSNKPFTIGIAGDSGTGKSEFLNKLEDLLGKTRILHIEGDGDHRWERGSKDWEKYTHLDPRANYLYRQAEDIAVLRAGNMVKRVDYDHNKGRFTKQRKIKPKPYIVLCGLHSLFLQNTRESLDLKIYMDTDEKLRRYWKIQRDTQYRGYSDEKVIEQIEKRIPDAKKYIYPQKEYADCVIRYFDSSLSNCLCKHHNEVISLEVMISASVNTELLVEKIRELGIKITLGYSKDITKQILVVDGETLKGKTIDYQQISEEILESYTEIFDNDVLWGDGVDGILQLILLVLIKDKMLRY